MSKIIKGSCNHCGKCCLAPIVIDNSCTKLQKGKCDFYTEELNDQKYGYCLILGRGNQPITAVRDREGNKITKEQIRWFEDNCLGYPKLEDMVKGHLPPEGCGFYIVEE